MFGAIPSLETCDRSWNDFGNQPHPWPLTRRPHKQCFSCDVSCGLEVEDWKDWRIRRPVRILDHSGHFDMSGPFQFKKRPWKETDRNNPHFPGPCFMATTATTQHPWPHSPHFNDPRNGIMRQSRANLDQLRSKVPTFLKSPRWYQTCTRLFKYLGTFLRSNRAESELELQNALVPTARCSSQPEMMPRHSFTAGSILPQQRQRLASWHADI